jgi:hypothetical protein
MEEVLADGQTDAATAAHKPLRVVPRAPTQTPPTPAPPRARPQESNKAPH